MSELEIDIPHESDEPFLSRHIASQHALVNVREDLRCGVRGIHEVTAKLRVLRVHQNLSVIDLAFGVHVGCSGGIGARKVGDFIAKLANPAEVQQIHGS